MLLKAALGCAAAARCRERTCPRVRPRIFLVGTVLEPFGTVNLNRLLPANVAAKLVLLSPSPPEPCCVAPFSAGSRSSRFPKRDPSFGRRLERLDKSSFSFSCWMIPSMILSSSPAVISPARGNGARVKREKRRVRGVRFVGTTAAAQKRIEEQGTYSLVLISGSESRARQSLQGVG